MSNEATLDALPAPLRETLRASLDLGLRETLERDGRATIEPRSAAGRPALDRALALLHQLDTGRSSLEVRATLGQGGMGIVHLAHQHALGRNVAVKRVRDEARSDGASLKLLREAWVTGALEHPNVVPVYDLRLDADGHPQIVLKKIDGAPWSDLLADDDALRTRHRARDRLEWHLRVLLEVADAIGYAHRRGIVHRDLKPENVMIGEFGEVYVVDWGLAVAIRDDGSGKLPLAAQATDFAGTPCYMAPEMAGGAFGTITERTDVFLLGAMLHEVVTGRPPRDGDALLHVVAQLFTPVVPPEGTDEELAAIMCRAMAFEPKDRYESVGGFSEAIEAYLAHRGSLSLTRGAEERLEDLRREAASAGSHDDRRLSLYHLFGECRFGFEQALRAWPDNERATRGLAEAVERMIEIELEEGDPRAADVLLASLPVPRPDLAARVASERRLAEEEATRRASLVTDHDPDVGRRTRVFVASVMCLLWTLGPLGVWALVRSDPSIETPRAGLVFTAALVAIGLALGVWARDSLSRSALNRGVVAVASLALSAQALLLVGATISGMDLISAHLGLMVAWAVCAGVIATVFEKRLMPAACVYVVGFLVASARPADRYLIDAVTNFCLLLNVFLVWGRFEQDVVAPARARGEARRDRLRDILSRRGVR